MSDTEKKIAEIREALEFNGEWWGNAVEGEPICQDEIDEVNGLIEANRFLLSELERLEREYAEERAAHNAHVTELCELEKENRKLREERDTIYADWNKEKDKQIQLTYELLTAKQEIERLREERDDLIDGLLVYAEQRIGSDDDGEHARDILKEIGVTVE